MRARNPAKVIDRSHVLLLAGEHRRLAMRLQDPCFLLRIQRQRVGRNHRDRAEITERRVMVFVGRRDLGRRFDRPPFNQTVELGAQAGRFGILGRRNDDVAALQIDQLLASPADVEVVGTRHGKLGRTAKTEVFRQRLRVNRPIRHLAGLALEDRAQRTAPKVGGDRRANEVEDRRQDVDVLHRDGNPAARPLHHPAA